MKAIIEEGAESTGVQWLRDQAIGIALSALSSRALVWVAALGAGTVWTFTILHPEWIRIVAAVGYCLTVLAPVLWRDGKGAG